MAIEKCDESNEETLPDQQKDKDKDKDDDKDKDNDKDKDKDKDREWQRQNSENWEPEIMTIFVTWQLIVTLDSIRNSCDVYL